jgi:hypothetical protein
MLKLMWMKSLGIGESFTFGVQRWVIGGKVSCDIQLGVNMASEGCKMVEGIFLLMVVILALSCCTSFWASKKSDDKVLRWASRSWLRVWAMMKGETRKG